MNWEGKFMEELVLNITLIVVRFCGGEYRVELILNITAFFLVRVWLRENREEMLLNVTPFFCEGLGIGLFRENDTDCYCVF
jgi:hypothetical protein